MVTHIVEAMLAEGIDQHLRLGVRLEIGRAIRRENPVEQAEVLGNGVHVAPIRGRG